MPDAPSHKSAASRRAFVALFRPGLEDAYVPPGKDLLAAELISLLEAAATRGVAVVEAGPKEEVARSKP